MTTGHPDAPKVGRAKRASAWASRARTTAVARARGAEAWAAETAGRRRAYDLAVQLFERDRDAFASVLGSAIALRLFLFTTSFIVAVVGCLNLIFGEWGLDRLLDNAGITGSLAQQMDEAATATTGRDLGFFLSGVFLALWAGRSLTTVLAACSAGAWRLDARLAKASVRVVVRVTGLIALIVIAGSGLNRLRSQFGVAVATGSVALNVAMLAAGWFFLTLSLPKPTRDPGAMIPGAVVFGTTMTLVQWFMHYYLPYKVANASEVMGSVGVTVASLGYLFFVGRIMAGCTVLNAVVWEQFGSISAFTFSLPGVRRVPERFPKVATFFDLEQVGAPAGDDTPADEAPADDAPADDVPGAGPA